jgi:hypothetical protein
MKLKYIGLSHERSFTKADFDRHGLDGGAAVRFNERNNYIAEVDDSVANWLIANEAPDFREATEDDETTPDMTRVGATMRTSGMVAPKGDAFDAPIGDDASTPHKSSGTGKKASASSTTR